MAHYGTVVVDNDSDGITLAQGKDLAACCEGVRA